MLIMLISLFNTCFGRGMPIWCMDLCKYIGYSL